MIRFLCLQRRDAAFYTSPRGSAGKSTAAAMVAIGFSLAMGSGAAQAKKVRDFLQHAVSDKNVAAYFEVSVADVVTSDVFLAQLIAAGVHADDAAENGYQRLHTPDDVRARSVEDELSEYSLDYFGTSGLSPIEVRKRVKQQGGYTPIQYLAYAKVGFGSGRCPSARVGSKKCPVTVSDIQTSIVKNLDNIPNVRYPGPGIQWNLTFAINREDIPYRLVFDRVAQKFGGFAHNPLRDVVLDVTDEASSTCKKLTKMFANGSAFEAWLDAIPTMPPSIAHTSKDLIDGVTEVARNRSTGVQSAYHYGLFNFLGGLNCSRLDENNSCYAGEPLMAQYILGKGVTLPQENGKYQWNCQQIATIWDVTVSNPHPDPYDAIATESTYQFDPDTYPLRNSPIDLTAEDVLMFMVSDSNAYTNTPYDPFGDSIPLADTQAMRDAGLLNSEFEFQYRVIPAVYDQFLK